MSGRAFREEDPVRFADLLRIRVFGVLFTAEIQSLVGDQLARVALAVLVFDRTGNAAATALTYAATFLPAILGGAVLARLGDRWSRLGVMVGCDVIRAACFAVMAVPGLSLWVLEAVLAFAVLLEPVFTAAQSSYLAQHLDEEHYRVGTGLRMATNQVAQIGGFAVGGALVALIEPRGALVVNAATFALSALLIVLGLPVADRDRPRSVPQPTEVDPTDGAGPPAWRIRDDPRLVMLIGLAALVGFFVVPEGLVVPYAHDLGHSTEVAGVLLAAIPAGGAIGAVLLTRFVPRPARPGAVATAAMVCGLPLLVTGWAPPWPVTFVAWFVSGAAAAYVVEVFSRLAVLAAPAHRARTMGAASAVLTGAQGVGLAVFGLLADGVGVGWSITAAGGCGVVAAGLLMTVGQQRHAGISRVWRDAPVPV